LLPGFLGRLLFRAAVASILPRFVNARDHKT
jgi:hypothetical protein